jgi:hypothetical protein
MIKPSIKTDAWMNDAGAKRPVIANSLIVTIAIVEGTKMAAYLAALGNACNGYVIGDRTYVIFEINSVSTLGSLKTSISPAMRKLNPYNAKIIIVSMMTIGATIVIA